MFLYCLQYGQVNEDHPQIYLAHLNKLLGKEFSFPVKYQPNFKQSSIIKLIEDKQIIETIKYVMVQMIKYAMVQHEVL